MKKNKLLKLCFVVGILSIAGCNQDEKTEVDYWLKESSSNEFKKTLVNCKIGNENLKYCEVVYEAYKIKKQNQSENNKEIIKNKLGFDK